MTDNNTRQQTLLDQYWDADRVNRTYIPAELDASLRQTVDQFHAADDAPAPDREFVDRLWTDLAGDVPEASTATPPWTEDPEDEPTEPQYVPNRKGNSMQARPQSIWKRRSRQILEMVAGVLVLALITGGLILAYQNLIGEGGGPIPGAGDEMGNMVPNLSSAGAIPWDGDILQRDGIGSVEIGRFDDQDYAFIFTVPDTQSGMESGPELRVVRLDQTGQHEQVGSLELDVPWTSSIGVAMGTMALVDDVLYLPIAAEERPGIWAVDVSNPENPHEITFVDLDVGFPTTIAGSDNGVLAAATFDGPVYFVDVSDPEQPEIVAEVASDTFGFYSTVEAPRMTFDDTRLFIAHHEGLSIVDVSESAEREVVGQIANPDFDPTGSGDTNGSSLHGPIPGDAWHDVLLIDDTAYVTAGDDGVRIFDVADPSAPMEIGQIEREDRTVRLVESNGFVYVLGVSAYDEPDQQGLDWTWSVDALDVSDPETPETVDRLPDLSGGTEDEDFLQVNTRHLVAGQDFILTFGSSGSLVTHIDWVEPADDEVAREDDITNLDSADLGLDQESIEQFQEEVERNREIIENFEPERVIEVRETLEYEGEELRIVSIELSSEAMVINTEQDPDHSLSPVRGVGFSVRFPDGSEHESFGGSSGTSPEMQLQEENVIESERFFPPAPEGADSIELVFHSFLVNDDEPIDVTFPVPDELADAELDADEAETQTFPVDHAFEVEGQTLEVTEMRAGVLEPGSDLAYSEEWFSILVQNPELHQLAFAEEPDLEATEGLIQFRSRVRDRDWITLVDDTGQEYEYSPYGAQFGVEGMGMGFEGPVNPDATEFTLRSEHRGIVVRPFEPLEISLGDEQTTVQPTIETNGHTVHFPRQSAEVHEYDDGAPAGTLAMDDQGCLRFGDEDGPLIIWPHSGHTVDLIDGEVALIDEETGNVIAHVGENVSFHGSDPEFPPDSVPDHMLDGPLPGACADTGGFFLTGPGIGGS